MPSKRIPILVVLTFLGLAGAAPCQEIISGNVASRPRLFNWALPSDTGHSLGYHVGGGAGNPRKAEPRRDDEGTWGWDYQGWLLPRRVSLGWWHGRRAQGGPGAYKTEGPRLNQEK